MIPIVPGHSAFFLKCRLTIAISAMTPLLLSHSALAAGQPATRLWKPVADSVYLQESADKFPTAMPATSVAWHGGKFHVVVGGALKRVEEDGLMDVGSAPGAISRIRSLQDQLLVSADDGAFVMSASGAWRKVLGLPLKDFCLHLDRIYGASADAVFRLEPTGFVNIQPKEGYLSSDTSVVMEDFSQLLADPVEIGPIDRIASYSGTLYLLRRGRLALLEGRTLVTDPVDWGMLPSQQARDMISVGSRLYVATDRGLGVLRGMAVSSLRGPDGLPFEDTVCLAQGFDGDIWVGTTQGAIRMTSGGYHFFGAQHWLPGNRVRDIACGTRSACIATDKGVSVIRYEPYTLAKKAAFFERELDNGGFKRLGFVHKLYWSGEQDGWLREISDNDGGHTAHYLAAMSFKFAATGDPRARAEALEAFKAMTWLDDITPKPGFIARAVWSVKADKGKRSERGSGPLPAKWYPTDDGLWLWKGDTSSDEVNGHFYAVSLFHDLAARGPEKPRAKQHIANITTHIIENGWVLRDMDGKPTRWGRWDPDYLLKPYGFEARGLNGMEAQTHVITAFALTGDQKYQDGLKQLMDWRYQTYTVRQKMTFPPDSIVTWDDELAFRCYHPLLRYTEDPDLRSIYLRSLERSWEVMRMQQLPYFNFIYGALTGNDCETAQAVEHLREWSLDLINHDFQNSHRSDLQPRPGYVPYAGGTRAISPRESEAMWGSRSALNYDGGDGGRVMTAPVGWLEDYWMGRYYGFIEAPAAGNTEASGLLPRNKAAAGAKPYDGPPRPAATWEK